MNTSAFGQPLGAQILNTRSILDAVTDNRALSTSEAVHLLNIQREDELESLQEVANLVRGRQVGDLVGYGLGCSLFLTNLCEMAPGLYPYPKTLSEPDYFIATIDEIDALLEQACHQKLETLYLSGGGFWSTLSIPGLEAPGALKTYVKVLDYIREQNPDLKLRGFSPDEIEFLCILANRNEGYILEMLMDHGLKALGGHGAEILVDSMRQEISPKKATVKRWLDICIHAKSLGLPVEARLEAGPLETTAQRVAHLVLLKQFSSRHPGTFSHYTPQIWTQPPHRPGQTAYPNRILIEDRLKLIAVSRFILGESIPTQRINGLSEQAGEARETLRWGANHIGDSDTLAYARFLAGKPVPEAWPEAALQEMIAQTGRPFQKF